MVGKAERVTLEALQQHFHLPMAEVAKKFNVCLTFFKRICRSRGIKKWPHRQLKSLHKTSQLKYLHQPSSQECEDHEFRIGGGFEAAGTNIEVTSLQQPRGDMSSYPSTTAGQTEDSEYSTGTSSSSCASAEELDDKAKQGGMKEHDKTAKKCSAMDILAAVASSALMEEQKSQRLHRCTEQEHLTCRAAAAGAVDPVVPEGLWDSPSNVTRKDLLPSLVENVSLLRYQEFSSNTPVLGIPQHDYIVNGMQRARRTALQFLQQLSVRNNTFISTGCQRPPMIPIWH